MQTVARWATWGINQLTPRSEAAGDASETTLAESQQNSQQHTPWPSDWAGEPFGAIKPAQHRFPCVGADCAARGAWHEAETPCRAYRDTAYLGRSVQWQHMCGACSDTGARLWQPALPPPARPPSPPTAEEDEISFEAHAQLEAWAVAQRSRADDQMEQPPCAPCDDVEEEAAAAAAPPPPQPHPCRGGCCVMPIPLAEPRAQRPTPPPPLTAAPPAPPPPYISPRVELGKRRGHARAAISGQHPRRLWQVAAHVPPMLAHARTGSVGCGPPGALVLCRTRASTRASAGARTRIGTRVHAGPSRFCACARRVRSCTRAKQQRLM